jgi:uncharacterized protein with HEPN domain
MKSPIEIKLEKITGELEVWERSALILAEILGNIEELKNEGANSLRIIQAISRLIGQLDSREGYIKNNHKEIPWKFLILLEALLATSQPNEETLFYFKEEIIGIKDNILSMCTECNDQIAKLGYLERIFQVQKELLPKIEKKIQSAQADFNAAEKELKTAQSKWEKDNKEKKTTQRQPDFTREFVRKSIIKKKELDCLNSRIDDILSGNIFKFSDWGKEYLGCDIEYAGEAKKIIKKIITYAHKDGKINDEEITLLEQLLHKLPTPKEGGRVISHVGVILQFIYSLDLNKKIDSEGLESITKQYFILNKISCSGLENESNNAILNESIKNIQTAIKTLTAEEVGNQKKTKKKQKKVNISFLAKGLLTKILNQLSDLIETTELTKYDVLSLQNEVKNLSDFFSRSTPDKNTAIEKFDELKSLISSKQVDNFNAVNSNSSKNIFDKNTCLPEILKYCYRQYDIRNLEEIVSNIDILLMSENKSPYVLLQVLLEIGESINNLTGLFKSHNPQLPYTLLTSLRNKIFHNLMDTVPGLTLLDMILNPELDSNLSFSVEGCCQELAKIKDTINSVLSGNDLKEYPDIHEYKEREKNKTTEPTSESDDYKNLHQLENHCAQTTSDANELMLSKNILHKYEEIIFKLKFIINQLEYLDNLQELSEDTSQEFIWKFILNICGEIFKSLKDDIFTQFLSTELKEVIDNLIITRGNLAHDIVLRAILIDKKVVLPFVGRINDFNEILLKIQEQYTDNKETQKKKMLQKECSRICNDLNNHFSGPFNLLLEIKEDTFKLVDLYPQSGAEILTNIRCFIKTLEIYLEGYSTPKIEKLKEEAVEMLAKIAHSFDMDEQKVDLQRVLNKTSIAPSKEGENNALRDKLKQHQDETKEDQNLKRILPYLNFLNLLKNITSMLEVLSNPNKVDISFFEMGKNWLANLSSQLVESRRQVQLFNPLEGGLTEAIFKEMKESFININGLCGKISDNSSNSNEMTKLMGGISEVLVNVSANVEALKKELDMKFLSIIHIFNDHDVIVNLINEIAKELKNISTSIEGLQKEINKKICGSIEDSNVVAVESSEMIVIPITPQEEQQSEVTPSYRETKPANLPDNVESFAELRQRRNSSNDVPATELSQNEESNLNKFSKS